MAAVLIDLTLIHCLRGPKLQIISSRNVNWSEDNWLHIKVGKHLPFHQVKIYSFLLQCSLVTLAMRANCLKYVRWLSKLFTSLFKFWGQKTLEHTGLCSAGVYPSSSALCYLTFAQRESSWHLNGRVVPTPSGSVCFTPKCNSPHQLKAFGFQSKCDTWQRLP